MIYSLNTKNGSRKSLLFTASRLQLIATRHSVHFVHPRPLLVNREL